jgi:predicted metalloprotease with PDZ domain
MKKDLRCLTRMNHAAKLICLAFMLSAFVPSAPAQTGSSQPALKLQYRLTLSRPTAHLIGIEIDAGNVTEQQLDFILPAWSPGRYAIYDFAKNVQEFGALGSRGRFLPWEKTDKQTWRVDARQAGGEVKVRYKVYANDLNGSFSQFDASHANLNGASIFMYVAGHKPDPIGLTVDPPKGWKMVSGFSLSPDEKTFEASSYDRLIDTPMEIAPDCPIMTFKDAGRTFRVAVHSYESDPSGVKELERGVEKIVQSEMAMMPGPDFEHYTFIFHFDPDIEAGDGMEHLNSTQIILRGSPSGSALNEALEDAAHEFFHVWNVKRLRPAALGPFDYTRENYTRSLWVAEGITSYYAYVSLLRSGLWIRQTFLDRLAHEISELEDEPGRKLMSAESSSFNAWFYDRAPQMQETNFANSAISYYNKGALLGMLLDLEIRSRTGGRKSLDDVMRFLYKEFYEAPAASYYGPGRGYQDKDVLDALNSVTGSDFASFFDEYVRGTEPLPYAKTLALAGLGLEAEAEPGAPPDLGILSEPEDRGVRIRAVLPGGAADRGGLSRDDLLIAVDDQSLASASLADRLRIYPAGASVPFTVERHANRERILVTLDPPRKDHYAIFISPSASPQQVEIRQEWLGKGN